MLFDVSFIPNIKCPSLYPFSSHINWYPIPLYCSDVIVFASHHLANTLEIHTYAHRHTHTRLSRLPIVIATAAERQKRRYDRFLISTVKY